MILDRIENAAMYAALHPRFARAFEIMRDGNLSQKSDGRYTVYGDDIYYTIQRYTTKPMFSPQARLGVSTKLEAHRKYIDIQFLLAGEEILGYAPLNGLTIAEEYNPQKDIAFYRTPKEITKVKLEPGLFCILFPNDAHLPCCRLAGPADVRKVVIKVRLNKDDA